MTVSVVWVDIFRIVDLILIAIFMSLLPFALNIRPRGREVRYLVICVECAYVSVAGSIISHFGDGLIWWLTPVQLVGTGAGVWFVFLLDRNAQKNEEVDRERYNMPTTSEWDAPRD